MMFEIRPRSHGRNIRDDARTPMFYTKFVTKSFFTIKKVNAGVDITEDKRRRSTSVSMPKIVAHQEI